MKLLSYKTLFWLILVVAVLEGYYIYRTSDPSNFFLLPPYSFYDSKESGSDDLVSASGSWIPSQTKLAFPVSTVNIECWREFGHCWIADATLTEKDYISSGLNLEEIQYWNDDFIETKPSSPLLGCVEEVYRLDRRSQTVSYTRRTIDNTSAMCEDIQEEPITASLGDGLKRIEVYHNAK